MKTYPLSSPVTRESEPGLNQLYTVHYSGSSSDYPLIYALFMAKIYYKNRQYFNIDMANGTTVLEYTGGSNVTGNPLLVSMLAQLTDIIAVEVSSAIESESVNTKTATDSMQQPANDQEMEEDVAIAADSSILAEPVDTLNRQIPEEIEGAPQADYEEEDADYQASSEGALDLVKEEPAIVAELIEDFEPLPAAKEPELAIVDVEYSDVVKDVASRRAGRDTRTRDSRKALDLGLLK